MKATSPPSRIITASGSPTCSPVCTARAPSPASKSKAWQKARRCPAGRTRPKTRSPCIPDSRWIAWGRLIEVPSARCLRLDQWLPGIAAAGANVLKPLELGGKRWLVADVFLRYLECRNGLQPGFPTTGVDATDAIVAARITDEFELVLAPRSSESAGQPPPLPKRPFQPAPANRRALLDALYARYDAPAELLEYPVAPNDNTPAGTPAKKLAEKTAVFLSRVLIRLTDPPASNLVRHGSNEFTIEDEARLALPATELFLSLTPLA